jgi:hypothetical protein
MSPSKNKTGYEKRSQQTQPPAPSVQEDDGSFDEERRQALTDEEARDYLRYNRGLDEQEEADLFDEDAQESQFDPEEVLQHDYRHEAPTLSDEPQQHVAPQLQSLAPIRVQYHTSPILPPQTTIFQEAAPSVSFAPLAFDMRQRHAFGAHKYTSGHSNAISSTQYLSPDRVPYDEHISEDDYPRGVVAGGFTDGPDVFPYLRRRGYRTSPTGNRIYDINEQPCPQRNEARIEEPEPVELLDMFEDTFHAIASMRIELRKLERKLKQRIGFPANTPLNFFRGTNRESFL